MEIKVKALILAASDSGENDKVVTCLTDAAGKIRAKLKGVKKSGAKFKFVAQPFCFCELILHRNGDFYTVIQAAPLELFYSIVTDLDKFYAASAVLECADAMTSYAANAEILPETLRALQCIAFSEKNALKGAVARFMSGALRLTGYELQLDHCVNCLAELKIQPFLCIDLIAGGMKCEACAAEGDRSIRKRTYEALKRVRASEYTDAESLLLPEQTANHVINLYGTIAESVFSKKLHAYEELIRQVR